MVTTNQCSLYLEENKSSFRMLGGSKHNFCNDCIKKLCEAKRTCPLDSTPFDSINTIHEVGSGAVVEKEKLETRMSIQYSCPYIDDADDSVNVESDEAEEIFHDNWFLFASSEVGELIRSRGLLYFHQEIHREKY
ncbi:unnamed protein product [Rodentolepis nana]|uniref:Zf-AD domain-containing protein n=1 Tax=Rodentolepis nana TaxID=102285 RepID=A0A0R3TGP8_RODNA|nr:unnamed protein product [Rodentolepis nana]